ncbi:GH32 C-terminal domain-containing protein, partial [Streptococcus suis]
QKETNNVYELELDFSADTKHEIVLFANEENKGLVLTVDTESGQITLDREQCGQPFALDFGTSRSCAIEAGPLTANIFIDKSVFEIFINKGEKVFSGRVFPDAN